ncbi:MAG TPA: hypothetical protein VGN83_24185 [Falsiroseomonas sp.]|jgi:TetR/AcrR family transcriptional repressor of nem operon|nr:hypothetical protein [Falsiroseomonas sp.]
MRAPRQAIETFLDEIVERSLSDPRGCLLINSALEVAPHDPDVGAVVAARLAEVEGFFRRCVRAGQADGSIGSAHRPAEALPDCAVMGLRVLARAGPDPALLRGAARQALALLDAPGPEKLS